MNTPESTSVRPEESRHQFSLRPFLVVVTVLCVLLSCYVWFRKAVVEPRERAGQIKTIIDSLAAKCPSSITSDQWEIAMWWTHNLTGNSSLKEEAKLDDLRRFQNELEEKSRGDVDMTTIFWIWDQHAKLTPAGERYQRFRQQMLDQMHWRPGPEGRNGDR